MRDFLQRHAPLLLLPPKPGGEKGWVTPEQQAGMAPPENMYSEQTGEVLPYMQEQGGARQFYVPEGQTATPLVPLQAPIALRGFQDPTFPQPQAPTAPQPNAPLRGMQNPSFPQAQPPVGQPNNLLTRPTRPAIDTPNANTGRPAHVRIPPPPGGGQGVTYENQRANVSLAQGNVAGDMVGNMLRPAGTGFIPPMNTGLPPGPGGQTLGDLLRSFNYRLPHLNPAIPMDSPFSHSYTEEQTLNANGTPRDSFAPSIDPRQFNPRTGEGDYMRALGKAARNNQPRSPSRSRPARPQ